MIVSAALWCPMVFDRGCNNYYHQNYWRQDRNAMRVASEKTQNHGNEIDKSALLSVAVHSEVWWGTQHADIAKSFVLIKMILLVSASRLTTGNWGRVEIEIFTFRTARTRLPWSWRLSPAPPWLRWRSRGRTPSISWASVYRTEWWDFRFYDKLYKLTQNYILKTSDWWIFADLQSVAGRNSRAGWGEGGPQDHWDQWAERCRRPSREDCQPPGHQCRRGKAINKS